MDFRSTLGQDPHFSCWFAGHCYNSNWRPICFLFLVLMLSFLCTVAAVLCTIHFKFLMMMMMMILFSTTAIIDSLVPILTRQSLAVLWGYANSLSVAGKWEISWPTEWRVEQPTITSTLHPVVCTTHSSWWSDLASHVHNAQIRQPPARETAKLCQQCRQFFRQAGMVATRLSRAPPPHWHDPCQLDGWSEVTVKDVDRLIWSCPPPCWRLLSMSWHHLSAGWQTRHLISPSYSSLSSSLQSQKLQWQNAALANTCDRLEPITSYVILFDTTFAVIE